MHKKQLQVQNKNRRRVQSYIEWPKWTQPSHWRPKTWKTTSKSICKSKATDILTRPAKIIRQTLQETDESQLQSSDLKSISQSLYRQRRKEYPALPKDRMETHACLENLAVKTSKDENFLAYNDSDAGMIIFTCSTNLQCMCDVDDIFIDGTF